MSHLIGIADPHLYAHDPLGEKRALTKELIFKRVVQHVLTSNATGLVIFGDLFEFPNPGEEFRERFYRWIAELFNYNKYVVYISGNHDSTATASCFSGEQILKHPLFKVHTGTEIRHLDVPRFEHILVVPWYASLTPKWWEQYENKLIFGHVAIQGALMNSAIECEDGITVSSLKERGLRIITGHFHKAQDHPQYNYIGCLYRLNFGECSYQPQFVEISDAGIIKRQLVDDWRFVIEEWRDDFVPHNPLISDPVALKFKINVPVNSRHLYSPNELQNRAKQMGYANVQYMTKQIIREEETRQQTSKFLFSNDVKKDLLIYAKEKNVPDAYIQTFMRWTGIEV